MNTTCKRCLATTTTTTVRVNIDRKGDGPVPLCVDSHACCVRARDARDARDAEFALEWADHKKLLAAIPFLL